MSRGLWLLLGGLVAAVLIPVLLGGSSLYPRLRSFPLLLLLAMFAMILLCWTLNAWRLRLLLGWGRIDQGRAVAVVIATEFAICATPAGAGGPLTLMALLSRHGVPAAQGTAIYALEQLCDLLIFTCALLGILGYVLATALDARLSWLLESSAALLVGALLLVALLGRYHRALLRSNGRLLARWGVRTSRRRRWTRKVLRFRNALRAGLRLPRSVLTGVLLLTGVHWALRYSVLFLTLWGLDRPLPWIWTFMLQMLALTAGQVSLLPGGAGSAELASVAMLAPLLDQPTAAAAILIWRAVTYYFYLVVGAPVFCYLLGGPLLRQLARYRGL